VRFREVPIGAAFDVRNGATPASGDERYWDGDVPWVTPADLGGLQGREVVGGGRAITPEGLASCGTQMVPAGSIILSIRAPVGHMAIAKSALCFNQGCRGLIPRRIIRTDFAYWAPFARRSQLEAAAQGTTFLELGRGKLRAERVPVPDVAAQQPAGCSLFSLLASLLRGCDPNVSARQRDEEYRSQRSRSACPGDPPFLWSCVASGAGNPNGVKRRLRTLLLVAHPKSFNNFGRSVAPTMLTVLNLSPRSTGTK
jgi:hypothetical protein